MTKQEASIPAIANPVKILAETKLNQRLVKFNILDGLDFCGMMVDFVMRITSAVSERKIFLAHCACKLNFKLS